MAKFSRWTAETVVSLREKQRRDEDATPGVHYD
jgi:hypothetical protein